MIFILIIYKQGRRESSPSLYTRMLTNKFRGNNEVTKYHFVTTRVKTDPSQESSMKAKFRRRGKSDEKWDI